MSDEGKSRDTALFAEDDRNAGERYFLAGEYEKAAETARAEIAAHPDRVGPYSLLGRALLRLRRFEEARAAFLHAVKIDPSCKGVHRELGNIHFSLGEFESALREVRRELALEPEQAVSHALLGRILNHQGKSDDALEAFGRAVAIDPAATGVYREMGDIYCGRGEYDKASAAARREIEIEPGRAEPYALLGRILAQQRRFDEAMQAFAQVLEIDHAQRGAHLAMGNIHFSRGAHDLALTEVRQELALDPAQAEPFMLLGRILHAQGKLDEALAAFGRAAAIDPSARGVYREMGDIYFSRGEPEKAIVAARKDIEMTPGQAAPYALLGRILTQQRSYDEALQAFSRALVIDPLSRDVRRELVEMHIAKGDIDQAMSEVRRGLELMPEETAWHVLSGRLLRRQDRHDDAIKHFSEALRIDPHCAGVHSELCDMYARRGAIDKAVDEARQEIVAGSGRASAYALLGRMLAQRQDHDEAMRAFEQALALDRACRDAHQGIGAIHFARGEFSRAAEEARQEIALDPLNASAYVLMGRLLIRQKKETEALEAFAKAAEIEPQSVVIRDEIGNICFTRPGFERTLSEARAGASGEPPRTWSYAQLAQGYFALKQHEKSLETMEGVIALTRGDPAAFQRAFPKIIEFIRYCNAVVAPEQALALLAVLAPIEHTLSVNQKNQLLCEREIAQGCSAPASRVSRLSVQVTNRCNLHCLMCAVVRDERREISPRVRDEIIAMMPYLREISWLGGEVFLYPDFDMLLSEGIKYAVRQGIVTNGLLLTEPMIAKIIANNVSLNFSIDGTTPEVYERIRRGARFGDLLEKIALFNRVRTSLKSSYQSELTMVVMRSNYHQIAEYVRFAHEHQFHHVRYQFIVNSGRDNEEDIFMFGRDDATLAGIEHDLEQAQRQCTILGMQFKCNITPDMLRRDRAPDPAPAAPCRGSGAPADGQAAGAGHAGPRLSRCFAPWRNIHIHFGGAVMPQAHCLCNNSIGNLNEDSMDAIWKGDKAIRYRELLLSGAIENVCPLYPMYGCIPYDALDDF